MPPPAGATAFRISTRHQTNKALHALGAEPAPNQSARTLIVIRVLRLTKPEPYRIALILVGDQGQLWEGAGGDVFDALMNLRLELEPVGIRVCCNGARANAWSSGTQRDMGQGYEVYLLGLERSGRPASVQTLDPAPCEEVVTVAEQRAFHERWLARQQ